MAWVIVIATVVVVIAITNIMSLMSISKSGIQYFLFKLFRV